MKSCQISILDLHYEILKEILIRVASSSGGANNFARAISVCEDFRQFIEDEDVLMAVNFDNLLISDRWELFQLIEGLIYRCARAKNQEAQFILAKIFLRSTSQLLRAVTTDATDREPSSYMNVSLTRALVDKLWKENPQLVYFMESFMPNENHFHTPGLHFHLVRLFLSRARFAEFEEMRPHMHDYMVYFVWCKGCNPEYFLYLFNNKCTSTVEKRLEHFEVKFSTTVTKMCVHAYKCMQYFGLEEAQQRLSEVVVAVKEEEKETREEHGGRFTMTTLVKKFNVSLKRYRTVRTVVEQETGKAIQRCSKNIKFWWLFLALDYYNVGALIEHGALEFRERTLFYKDQRANLISMFDALFCQFYGK